jgi:hypothetical protein
MAADHGPQTPLQLVTLCQLESQKINPTPWHARGWTVNKDSLRLLASWSPSVMTRVWTTWVIISSNVAAFVHLRLFFLSLCCGSTSLCEVVLLRTLFQNTWCMLPLRCWRMKFGMTHFILCSGNLFFWFPVFYCIGVRLLCLVLDLCAIPLCLKSVILRLHI